MSTTVSYKGQTLTTVSNDTKTLLTEGKYLEDDLTLVDDSGGGSTLITKSISANGTYNASSDSADGYSQVTVAVPASAVDTGTKSITSNGTHDVVGYASASVAVPNSYSASDEGKVVSNGALVAQTSDTVTTNDTYDTTLINSLTVNVSGVGGFSYPWGCSLETVTIGANSISNMSAAGGYFSSYAPWGMFVLKTSPTQNNQVVAYGNQCLRYRNGSIQTTGNGSSYDGILVEGTQYDVYRVNY